ncbi:MAG: hypothetical protein RMA76_19405 [Deltaproteobacteria bacterium]|jgi:hypothetical protein
MRRLSIVLIMMAAVACSSADTQGLDGDRDAGVAHDAGTPPRDGGEARDGGERDAGAPVDAGPARTLVEFSLLGDSPPDNLVMNPNLTSLSTVGPFTQVGSSATRHFAHTPTRQPALELAANDSAFVFVQAEPGMTTASVWMGVRDGDRVDGTALILGLAQSQLDAVLQLLPSGETVTMDGITWQRFEGSTMLQLIGANLLFIENSTRAPLFVTGPTVVARQAQIVGELGAPKIRLGAAQRLKAEALLAKHREALMQDMKPVSRRLLPRSP